MDDDIYALEGFFDGFKITDIALDVGGLVVDFVGRLGGDVEDGNFISFEVSPMPFGTGQAKFRSFKVVLEYFFGEVVAEEAGAAGD